MSDKRSSPASATPANRSAAGPDDTQASREGPAPQSSTPHQPLNPHSPIKLVTGPQRVLYLALAAFFFGLGFLGALLPILPTTPFLLLTSYFLVRSFPALNDKLLQAPLVGQILRDWQVRRGVRPHVKAQAVVVVLLGYVGSFAFVPMHWSLRLIMTLLVAIGLSVILRLPRPIDDFPEEDERESLG